MRYKFLILIAFLSLFGLDNSFAQSKQDSVPAQVMQQIYNEVKTPYKYGLVMVPNDNSQKVDCPTIFRKNGKWYMSYFVFNGRGYETWLANSKDLLHWQTQGRIMSFSDTSHWDNNQKGAYFALINTKWGGSYDLQKYDGKYWMSYFGGHEYGYEKGALAIGIAYTDQDPTTAHEWSRLDHPVLSPVDKDVSWWDNHEQYKEMIIWDKTKLTGHQFVMYYNANGDSVDKKRGAERIGMATSDDMLHWKRYGKDPVLNHGPGITGDPDIQKIGDVYVMFYFGAFWKTGPGGVFNRFACSYDLVHWTDWNGEKLIHASEPFDNEFAHKSYVVKWKGVVYHFYCAVNKSQQRGIAVATSKDLGKSELNFVAPPVKIKKK